MYLIKYHSCNSIQFFDAVSRAKVFNRHLQIYLFILSLEFNFYFYWFHVCCEIIKILHKHTHTYAHKERQRTNKDKTSLIKYIIFMSLLSYFCNCKHLEKYAIDQISLGFTCSRDVFVKFCTF